MSKDQIETNVTVHVCTTCRAEGEAFEPAHLRSGARLYEALNQARSEADPLVAPVECMSVCRRPCTISFSAEGSWTYIYGDFPADAAPETILAAARLYARSPQGLVPWKERSDAFKKGVVARVPPLKPATQSASRSETLA